MESEFFGHERGAFTGATERARAASSWPTRPCSSTRSARSRSTSSQAAARAAGKGVRTRRRQQDDQGQCPDSGDGRTAISASASRRQVPAGPLLPAQRLSDPRAGAAGARDDLALLAEAFLKRYARKHGLKAPSWSERALAEIRAYSWPGNVRELQNTVERAVILAEVGRPIPPPCWACPPWRCPRPPRRGGRCGGRRPPPAAPGPRPLPPPPRRPAPPAGRPRRGRDSFLSLDGPRAEAHPRGPPGKRRHRTQAARSSRSAHPHPAEQAEPLPRQGVAVR